MCARKELQWKKALSWEEREVADGSVAWDIVIPLALGCAMLRGGGVDLLANRRG